ncbi:NAD(P)/FAD-dependent oxidoreductase [Calothrix rhizosoleniae]|uniref:NAD(P)/FAD-dependent oxidoreductase n=1 Tax=Calothrix rhizosoleniae TaxID=888997 RepID=UPI000B49C848|nr:NAD(P)/FAD-dependent oxidoreductase [Calothrix rhizosoleniae]
MQTRKIIVIGGGAAGFFAAIAAAEINPHVQVTLLEASRKPLAKVLISGGGRCNVTHACFEPALLALNYPRGGKALRGAFTRFQAKDTIAWFKQRGVKLKTEADGRMFPVTDNSQTIADCLMETARVAGVDVRIGTPVVQVKPTDSNFAVILKSAEVLECDRLLLATGSNPIGYKIAQDLGHLLQPPVPSLFTFNIPEPKLRKLAGVSLNSAHLRLSVSGITPLEQIGPLLITHWGVSGPAVLKLSAWGARILHDSNYQATLTINWLPEFNQEQLRQQLLTVKNTSGKRAIALHRGVNLPHRLWQYILERAAIDTDTRWAEVSKSTLNKLITELSQGEYLIHGKGVFKDEFVTCGGVSLKQINFKTMESRVIPRVHFAGEILDIDGITGGFNFQSAWTTGYLAGLAMGDIA